MNILNTNSNPQPIASTEGLIHIFGSMGNLWLNADGTVARCENFLGTLPEERYSNIRRFDLAEYRQWEEKNHPGVKQMVIDILLVGYWYTKNGQEGFEQPAHDYRGELTSQDGTFPSQGSQHDQYRNY